MMTEAHDAIVIGAGVLGASISLELARTGRDVLCVDAGPAVGAGSTSSSSAIIRFNYSIWDSVLTAWEAAHRWKQLADHLGHEDPDGMVRFVKTGGLALDKPGDNRPTVTAHFRRAGIPYVDWSADDMHDNVPALDPGDFHPPRTVDDPLFADEPTRTIAGYYTPDCGFIDDPMRAAGNFMAAARNAGAALRLNTKVVEIIRRDGRVGGVRVEGGRGDDELAAPVVINVAGPASSRINELAGVSDEMRITNRPLRQEVSVLETPPRFTIEKGACLVSDPGLGVYLRPHLASTVLIGGSEPACDPPQWIDDPDDFNDKPTPEVFEAQILRAARRLPELRIPLRPTGLAALYDVSDDWVPLYDKTSLPGYFMACGTSGNQFKNAPMVGEFLTALVEAAEAGHDHDEEPVRVVGDVTGEPIDLGAFSRLRDRAKTTNSVLG